MESNELVYLRMEGWPIKVLALQARELGEIAIKEIVSEPTIVSYGSTKWQQYSLGKLEQELIKKTEFMKEPKPNAVVIGGAISYGEQPVMYCIIDSEVHGRILEKQHESSLRDKSFKADLSQIGEALSQHLNDPIAFAREIAKNR